MIVESAVRQIEESSAGQRGASGRGGIGEVIEGPEEISVILHAPSLVEDDLLVLVRGEYVEVSAADFYFRRRLPAEVEPHATMVKYQNGVLSIMLNKRF